MQESVTAGERNVAEVIECAERTLDLTQPAAILLPAKRLRCARLVRQNDASAAL